MNFKPDQSVDVVPLGEAGRGLGLVLVDAANKVICDAQIERPVSAAGENIDVERQDRLLRVIPGQFTGRHSGRAEGASPESMNTDRADPARSGVHGFRARPFGPSRNDGSFYRPSISFR